MALRYLAVLHRAIMQTFLGKSTPLAKDILGARGLWEGSHRSAPSPRPLGQRGSASLHWCRHAKARYARDTSAPGRDEGNTSNVTPLIVRASHQGYIQAQPIGEPECHRDKREGGEPCN
jgi:hypothetical protein